ncbi:MAG: hypothetical protein PUC32_06035 [Oscillospiraceae bacterium]|nr:hypothetical protein [Oscillospiraceae bacterium]
MVTLIVGKKGAGKTKKLVDAANAAAKSASGNVVVVEVKTKLTLDISHEARLITLQPYEVSGADALYGFVAGICAGNYDVQEIFVDSVLQILDNDSDLAPFIEKVDKLAKMAETKVTFSVSMAEEDLPESLKDLVTIVA